MITVMGATGNVGRKVVQQLLAQGETVRAVGRNPEALAELAAAGAQIHAGDAADAAFLTEAFRGADAAHTMLPYSPGATDFRAEQECLGTAIAAAVRDSGVRTVVAVSSLGAELPSGTGFIAASLHPQERRLRALEGVDVLFLRPGLFFESVAAAAEVIEATGVNLDVVAPDVAVPMVSTHDVAEAAATALRARDWSGFEVREVLGPRDLTYPEATRILGAAMGRPDVPYVQVSGDEMVAALVQAGFTSETAALQVEMATAISTGTITPREGRTARSTTHTRFEDVVTELVPDRKEAS
ncbi:NmrA family NAD(P)-binding protein [Pseudonocardia zijingensis]|uniref:NmrA family NAD(P)-binding protein n=2 Tax=Pseudonocardia zijingensis TaxID=153376 RepID=A0ABP4B842_9PSEU